MHAADISRRSLLAGIASVAASGAVGGVAAAAPPDRTFVDPTTPDGAQPVSRGRYVAHTLVFSDEFNGTVVDQTKWFVPEQRRSAKFWYKPDNVSVADGNLGIAWTQLADDVWGGGQINSYRYFNYAFGTMEVRIHMPSPRGQKCAVWMQAHDGTLPGGVADGTARDGEEIDIMETSGDNQYATTVHWDGYGKYHQVSSETVVVPGATTGYHVVGLNWTPEVMEFTYDGSAVRTITDPKLISQVKEYPVLSHEIYGDPSEWPPQPSYTMYVDYIRIWQSYSVTRGRRLAAG